MRRISMYLPEPLIQRAKDFAKNANVSMAEIIRRALEQYLK